MEAGGKGHVDGVDVGVIEDGIVASVHLGGRRDAIGGGESGGLVDRTAADGDDGGIGCERDGSRYFSGYVGASEDSESDRRVGHVFGVGRSVWLIWWSV